VISPTRIRDLVGYAIAVTAITWLAMRQWYGDLPRLNSFVPLSLLLLAIVEVLAANQLRDRIRRRPGALPVQPLVAARMLALAKASVVVGAVMLGIWAGLLLYAVPRLDLLAAASGDTRTGIVGVVAALALVAAALWLEYSCRAPTPPDSDRTPRPDGASES
jgi:sterol desaturase/sphingolipid hydroxylase (fatty acid hydroxylase superfamily)